MTPDPRIDIVWPLLARPNCDLWERHQAEQLAARILQALDDARQPLPADASINLGPFE